MMITLFNNTRFLFIPTYCGFVTPTPLLVAVLRPFAGYSCTSFGCIPNTTAGMLGMNNCLHDNYSGSIAMIEFPSGKNGHRYEINGQPFDLVLFGNGVYDLTPLCTPLQGLPDYRLIYTVTDDKIVVTWSYGRLSYDPVLNWSRTEVFVHSLVDIDKEGEKWWWGLGYGYIQDNIHREFPDLPEPKVTVWYSQPFLAKNYFLSGTPKDQGAAILKLLNQRFLLLYPYFWEDRIWGDLSQQSCNNVKLLDINSLAYIGDLVKLKELVFDTIKLLKGKADLKSIANLFLTVKYAILTFIDDSKEVAKVPSKMKKHQFRNCDSTRSRVSFTTNDTIALFPLTWETSFNQKIYYLHDDPTVAGAIRLALTTGLFPSLSNVWDFVPFSFVVNWFVDIGGLLEKVDTNTFISTLPIMAACQTRCDKTAVVASALPELEARSIQGFIHYQHYRRDIVGSIIPPLLLFDEKKISISDHWVEAAALIIQRGK